jgi:hypothetical protein
MSGIALWELLSYVVTVIGLPLALGQPHPQLALLTVPTQMKGVRHD